MRNPIYRTVTFVTAPDLPPNEIPKLKKQWNKRRGFLNYDVHVMDVPFYRGGHTVICAPDIPAAELKSLRKQVDKKDTRLVFTNYKLQIVNKPTRTEHVNS